METTLLRSTSDCASPITAGTGSVVAYTGALNDKFGNRVLVNVNTLLDFKIVTLQQPVNATTVNSYFQTLGNWGMLLLVDVYTSGTYHLQVQHNGDVFQTITSEGYGVMT